MLPVSPAYADIYDRLMTVIETSQGRLGILIAVVDERRLREQIIQSYEQEARQAQIEPYRIELGRGGSLRGKLAELREAHPHLQEGGAAVITVTGAELLLRFNLRAEDEQKTPLEEFFGYLQWTREGMREFPYPIVLWLNHRLLKEISFKAPDFWSWRKGVFWFSEEFAKPLEVTIKNHSINGQLQIAQQYNTQEFLPPLMELQQTIAELEATEPDSPNLANLYESLGDIYEQQIKQEQSPNPQQNASQGFYAFRQAISRYYNQADYSSQSIALLKLGNFLSNQSLFADALDIYQEMLIIARQMRNHWNEGIALGSLGNAYYSLDQFDQAVASYNEAIKITPDNYDAWNNRGVTLAKLGSYEESISSFDKILAIKPDYYQAWNNRGIALRNLGFYEESISSFDKVLVIQPDYYQAWSLRGIVLRSLGRYEEAITSLNKALEIKPDYYEGWDSRSILLVDLGQYEEAIICCKKSLQIKPDNHKAWKLQGFVLRILGRYKEAISSFDKALEIYREIGLRKDEADTLKQLAEARQALGDLDLARQYCQQALVLAIELGIPLAAECETLQLKLDKQLNNTGGENDRREGD